MEQLKLLDNPNNSVCGFYAIDKNILYYIIDIVLTKDDLAAIENLLDDKLETKLEEKLDRKLNPIKSELKKMRKDINLVVKIFDRDIIETRRRVGRIENHLNFSSSR